MTFLDTRSAVSDLPPGTSRRPLRCPEGSGGYLGLHYLGADRRLSDCAGQRPRNRLSRPAPLTGPGSPVMPVEMGPSETGGDSGA